ENWGAAETFYRLSRALAGTIAAAHKPSAPPSNDRRRRCNVLGPTAFGFRHRYDVREITTLLSGLGIEINVIAPLGATPTDLTRLPDAGFNVVLYPEIAGPTAQWLERAFGQPATKTIPIGVQATRSFISEVATLAGLDSACSPIREDSRLPWYSRS